MTQVGQAVVRTFPGFGILYADGRKGIRVVHAYSQGASRIVLPDGSRTWTTPPPTIYELYPMGSGGFTYESGKPVTVREHLESIGDKKFRERALKWFDNGRDISEEATKDVPERPNTDDLQRPETLYAVSIDLPKEGESPITREELAKETGDAVEHIAKQPTTPPAFEAKVISVLDSILGKLDTQQKEIDHLKRVNVPSKKREIAQKQSEAMKKKWADPEYRSKVIAKNPVLQKRKNEQNSPETS